MARKRQITYTSKETSVVLGLSFLLITIILIIALFDDSAGSNLFARARQLLGYGLPLAIFACTNLSLYFLEVHYIFSRQGSVIAQTFLTLLFPAFLSATLASERISGEAAAKGLSGGQLGHFLSWELFYDRPFANFTPHILAGICVILIMVILSISLEQIGVWLGRLIRTIGRSFMLIFKGQDKTTPKRSKRQVDEEYEEVEEEDETENTKATMLGDFNRKRQIEENQDSEEDEDDNSQDEDENPADDESGLEVGEKLLNINVKEADIGDDGLFVEELVYPNWKLPPLSLLTPYKKAKGVEADTGRNSEIIEQTLASFNIEAKVVEVYVGPAVVQYALNIPLGIKVNKIAGLAENVALALGVAGNQIRIEPIPGTTYLGIEAPRSNRETVMFKELCENLVANDKTLLGASIGKDIHGEAILADIVKMPHLLIAGATGSGKSVLTNAFITSLLMKKTPDELKLILVDPKQVELQDYNGIPHLLTPVITDMTKVVNALNWLVAEMEARYTKFAEAKVRNIEGYNGKMGFAAVPYIVVVIDEMADMMLTAGRNDAETAIVRLAQKARATGIHLILATQRPSVNVITGIIKANIPGRIGMSVTSSTDSRVILDQVGAESLLGYGDLLYKAPDKTKSNRVQSPFISQEEIGRVVEFIKNQAPEVHYATSILESQSGGGDSGEDSIGDLSGDDLFSQAVRVVVGHQKGSSSFLQRRLNIGFNRAARLLDEMEEAGVVGAPNGSKPREVLISDADAFLNSFKAKN